MRWVSGIRARFFLSLLLLAAALLAAVGWGSARSVRSALERELDLRLQAVAGSAVAILDPALIPGLVALAPDQGASRLHREKREDLLELCRRTGVRRLFVADTTGRSIIDTDVRVGLGTPLPRLRADRASLERVHRGEAIAGPLFRDQEGEPRKTGYVPLVSHGEVVGLVGAEADATFLTAIQDLRIRFLWLSASSLLLAFVLAVLAANGLTRSLDRLVQWGRGFGRGDLETPPDIRGRDEIGFLAQTLEQARRDLATRDREQRAMVAGVAHEIRNPLGGIRLYAELLGREPDLSPTARARLEKILRELDHLGTVVDEFLSYARPGTPAVESVSVASAVSEVLDLVRGEAERRGVKLEGPAFRAAKVAADPTHLRQIVLNLVRNALEASPENGAVRVEATRHGETVRIAIEDEGAGVPEDVRDRLFEPFFTTKATGSGLGLAIARRLTLGHRGHIELEPSARGGARFVVVLPVAEG